MSLLAATTFWLERSTQSDGGGRSGKHRHDPDYMVDNFQLRRFDIDGNLQHTLVARKMEHYPDDDSTRIEMPQLIYHKAPTANVSADQAWLDKDGKQVTLDGNVRVTRNAAAGGAPTLITTSVLYAQPEEEQVYTDAPVTLTQGHTVIRGSGLETNRKTHIAVLHGRVHGTIYKQPADRLPRPQESKPNERSNAKNSPAG